MEAQFIKYPETHYPTPPYRLPYWHQRAQPKTKPFRHFVLDDWWDPYLLESVKAEIGTLPEEAWTHQYIKLQSGAVVEDKRSINFKMFSEAQAILELRNRLASSAFIHWLEQAIRIGGLHFDDKGGGVHRIMPCGLLGQHIDFNVDDAGRWRRVNVLIYLGTCGRGGELVLFDQDAQPARTIGPKMNRMAIFECSEKSWHGHPTPLQGKKERLSIAAYYFTYEKPENAAAPHSTVWKVPQ